MKVLTHIEACELVINETKNALIKCEVLDRMYRRLNLKGGKYNMMMGQNQTQISQFTDTIRVLEGVYDDYLTEAKKNTIVK